MKIKYIIFACLISVFTGCEIDNYDEPNSEFSGNVTYEGEPIGVAYNDVRFQLWQSGFGNEGPMDVHLDQDGSFSMILFDGDYRLKFIEGQGPFRAYNQGASQGDTIYLDIQGNTQMDLEVEPYYMIHNESISLSGNTVEATASLEQIITDEDARDIEHVTLYLNERQFVSNNADANIASADANIEDLQNLSMEVEIPGDVNQDYIFARIGVRIQGVEDMIFSDVEKFNL